MSEEGERDKLCTVCWAPDLASLVEPVNTSCGHLFCWPCLWNSASNLHTKNCPTCKQIVDHVTPVFSFGGPRNEEHANIPPRPTSSAVDPFQNLSLGGVRRSSRHRTANIRLIDFGPVPNHDTSGAAAVHSPVEALGTASTGNLTESAGSLPGPSRSLPIQQTETPRMRPPPGPEATEILQSIFGHTLPEARAQDYDEASDQDYGVDMSDDEEHDLREAENAGIIRRPPVPRFKIKDYIPETNLRHLDVVIQEVEDLMVTKQIQLKKVNFTLVAKRIRARYSKSFPPRNPTEVRQMKSIGRIVQNGLNKALNAYKEKVSVLSRTGNSGPPETPQDTSLRTILEIDYTASNLPTRRNPSSSTRGRKRPTILDPQPIVTGNSENRSMTPMEREASDVSLGLDRPVVDTQLTYRLERASQGSPLRGTEREVSLNSDNPDHVNESQTNYRRERASQAKQGAQLRQSSLAEMHKRKNPAPQRAASTTAALVSGASATLEVLSSQRSGMETFLVHNMQVRESERERDREDRKMRDVKEKEEREQKEKNEREQQERKEKDDRDERSRRDSREERMNLILFKMIGGQSRDDQDNQKKKEIKVTARVADSESQPLPAKLVLTTMETLLRDLNVYMSETIDVTAESSGIVVEESPGEAIFVTDVDQILDVSSKFLVEKFSKRGKQYWKLIKN